MSLLHTLNRATFGSSIGKKMIVAISGILLIGFLLGHLIGNLQIYLAPNWINAYGHHLQTFPLLWPIRLGLLAIFALHIYTTILLVRENRAARPKDYAQHPKKYSTLAARTMALSGLTLIAFVVFHILHFTTKTVHPEYKSLMTTIPGESHPVPDVHSMMIIGFQSPVNVIVYIVAMGLLCLHLSHGFASLWQTFGMNSRKLKDFWKGFGYAFSAAIFIGYASIPVSILTGFVKRHEAAAHLGHQDPVSGPALLKTELDDPNAPPAPFPYPPAD